MKYVLDMVLLGNIPVLKAFAFSVVVFVIEIAYEYWVEVLVGSLPFTVYRIETPASVWPNVIDWVPPYRPASLEKSTSSNTSVALS